MILNVSQVLEFQACPVRWQNRYIHKRAVAPTAALSDGTYWHKLAEAWLKGDPLLPAAEGAVQDRMRALVEEGGLPRLPVCATEIALEMPLGRHTLVGTLDGILPDDPGFWSLQWKTCAGGQDFDRQCDAVKMSYHECAYEALMNHNGYPCRGTHLGVYKKLTKAELAAGVWPLHFAQLVRPVGYVDQVLKELEAWADRMEDPLTPLPNRRTCIQGFVRCQYWGSCYEGVSLSDLRYSDAEDRYGTKAGPESSE